MAENYKHLYEQTKKMLTMYQDELVPGFRKQIEELEENLAEREKVVIQLRKQWQDAEMHICTMCGHFNHKADGNVVYGNKNCGEICGYPFCKEKFTPWIPVSEQLPKKGQDYLCRCVIDNHNDFPFYMVLRYYLVDKNPHFQHESGYGLRVTHWMAFEPVEVGNDQS